MQTISAGNAEALENAGASHLDQAVVHHVFVRSRSVVSRRVAGETLIVPVRGKVGDLASIYSFNGTGSLIWDSLESPKGASDLVDVVEREYAVTHEKADQDVKQFLQDMLSVGLVEAQPAVAMAAMGTATHDLHAGAR